MLGALVLLGLLALSSGLSACGDSGGPANAAHTASSHARDRDNDGDHNDDDAQVIYYGHAANATVRQSAIALVRGYYAAAMAENGRRACAMLVPLMAELVVEEDGKSPALRGRTCAVVMSKMFALQHRQLVEKGVALQVLEVRVNGDRGVIVLNFPEIPEARQFDIRRIDGSWKLTSLFDGIIE